MLKKAALFLGLALTLKVNAFAWVGGPFGNGGFSNLIERNGVYHATFSFKNGSGYAYFTPENSWQPAPANNGGVTTTSTSSLSVSNRSIIYYQGKTFIGMAAGSVDLDKRKVTGHTNGYSEFSSTTTSSDSQGGSQSSSSTIVYNGGGAAYAANIYYTAKIKQSFPQVRFRGKGELAIISPNAFQQVSEAILEDLTENMSNLIENMSDSYQEALDAIVATHLPPSKVVAFPTQEVVETGTGSVVVERIDTIEVSNDPFTQDQIQAALDLMNLVADNNLLKNQQILSSTLEQLYDTLTPPSAAEISDLYTVYVPIRVTGVLRTL